MFRTTLTLLLFLTSLFHPTVYASFLGPASSSAIAWSDQGKTEIDVSDGPTMAVAQNHIFFFGVPSTAAGSTPIFVIHCMFLSLVIFTR